MAIGVRKFHDDLSNHPSSQAVIQKRLLALDVRPRSFGFVAIEEPYGILDWGVKSFRGGVNKVRIPFGPKVEQIIDQFAPDILIVKCARTKRIGRLIELIRTRANKQKVRVRLLSPKNVDLAFPGYRNKHQIAATVADKFPELLSLLPSPRRPWQSEDYRMSIFDAAAVGIAYLSERQTRHPVVHHQQ
jgi:hypothetical protein